MPNSTMIQEKFRWLSLICENQYEISMKLMPC